MRNSVVLHVEDDDAMAFLFRAALEEAGVDVSVYRVSDGEQALSFVRNAGVYSGARRPHLLILDLNMPKIDGWTVLSEMQEDESLRDIPIAVFSTSSRTEDRLRAYALGARTFVVKPQSFDKLLEEVRSLSAQFLEPELRPLELKPL